MLNNFALYQLGPISKYETLFAQGVGGGGDSPLLDLLGFAAGKKRINKFSRT